MLLYTPWVGKLFLMGSALINFYYYNESMPTKGRELELAAPQSNTLFDELDL